MNIEPWRRIRVKPIILFPAGVPNDDVWDARWKWRHIAVREKFRVLLKQRDSFELAELEHRQGRYTPAEYKQRCFDDSLGMVKPKEGQSCSQGVETILHELLDAPFGGVRYDRFTLPYVLSVLMVDPKVEWGDGGGMPLNGGYNHGGGIVVIPSWQYDKKILTSTLIHELGHAFGLIHTNERTQHPDLKMKLCYYGLHTSNSIMSWNKKNHTNTTLANHIPGCLLGDEIEALNRNRYVFPSLHFDPIVDFDCPPSVEGNCPAHDGIIRQGHFGPMPMLWCTSSFGSPQMLNDTPSRWILSSHPEIGFEGAHMWHSKPALASGWVSLDVTFPAPVNLSRIQAYTEHSGQHHRAHALQAERKVGGDFVFVKRVNLQERDVVMSFDSQEAQVWRLAFKAGSSGQVVVRGLRFFIGDRELYPPIGPRAFTEHGETFDSQVGNLVEIQRIIRANTSAVGFDAATMWHSGPVNAQGWVSLTVVFPVDVNIDAIRVASQHSGVSHAVEEVQVEVADEQGQFTAVAWRSNVKPVCNLSFPKREGRVWKLAFRNNTSGHVVVRGLRFFTGNEEFYPPVLDES